MLIVSWNMAHRRSNWSELATMMRSGPAIALLQEAPPVPDDLDGIHAFAGGPDPNAWVTTAGFERAWSTGVAWTDGLTCVRVAPVPVLEATGDQLASSHPGAYAAALIGLDDHTSLGVVSLYGIWDRQEGVGSYSEATLHRTLSDLTPWLQRPPDGGLIIAGDFNSYLDYGDGWDERYMTVFRRLEAYGLNLVGPQGTGPLEGCPCRLGDRCRHVQTYAHQGSETSRPFQLDFVWADDRARALVGSCEVVSGVRSSDHMPITTRIGLAPASRAERS